MMSVCSMGFGGHLVFHIHSFQNSAIAIVCFSVESDVVVVLYGQFNSCCIKIHISVTLI